MKKLLFSALAALSTMSVNAQFNYTFSQSTDAYTPLSSGTSINGNIVWDDELFKAPIGFTFEMDGVSIDSLSINSANIVATDSIGTVNAFLAMTADLIDRNLDTGTTVSLSPIRYLLTGTTPNRIFKVEVSNAGFFEELDNFGTTNDSISYQVWLYEGSNIVELRYGNAQISHPDLYYYNDSMVVNMGYGKNFNADNGTIDMLYFLKGDPTAATIDSTNNLLALNEGLETMPDSGTVYRFTPPTLSVKNAMVTLSQVSVYPTAAQNELTINNGSKDAIGYNVFSMTGAISALNGNVANGTNKIDISGLPAGMYTIQLSNDKVAKAVKFTKL